MMVAVEAEHVWWQQHARSAGPEDPTSWHPVSQNGLVGRLAPAPPGETRLVFGKVRHAHHDHDGKGLIGLGPPTTLPPGRYRTTWWLAGRPSHSAPDDRLVTCGIDVQHKPRAVIHVASRQFADSRGAPFPVLLEIELQTVTNDVAFVTFWHGQGDVFFVRIESTLMR